MKIAKILFAAFAAQHLYGYAFADVTKEEEEEALIFEPTEGDSDNDVNDIANASDFTEDDPKPDGNVDLPVDGFLEMIAEENGPSDGQLVDGAGWERHTPGEVRYGTAYHRAPGQLKVNGASSMTTSTARMPASSGRGGPLANQGARSAQCQVAGTRQGAEALGRTLAGSHRLFLIRA
eukprot:CAMPEP_0178519916 /NCGR_PEP_ID=MMETSP0696-20121128/27109_1 /TAXON_ID=265572 /ORGANISM="Extubocellulus spinifer, Strain CCMP396" /LENGTH=177 /DNA_ID=CAMNT_0020150705 /DNA_START=191 /DNA_END=725 /DNA_ORIENTATION=+